MTAPQGTTPLSGAASLPIPLRQGSCYARRGEDYTETMTETLTKLQEIGEAFHALADDVLRHLYPRCRALQPFGRNAEGKPIKGTPDSFVGPSPKDCTIAVEYTTTATDRLLKKWIGDYDGAIEKCRHATEVILCTNRPETEAISAAIKAKADKTSKRLTLVWGEQVADALDTRQDLRHEYLGIAHRVLTRESVTGALLGQVRRALDVHLGSSEVAAVNGRLFRRPMEPQFQKLHRSPGLTLVVADAGQGKTSWAAATALRFARVNPTVWFPAKEVSADGLPAAIVRAAYGVSDATKAHELITLLQSTRHTLLVFVDAIDEHCDYAAMLQCIRGFVAHSALAPRTHLILTCRAEAVEAFEEIDRAILPALSHSDGRRLTLDPLRKEESEQLLLRLGTTRNDIDMLRRTLPSELFGNPLYLKLARPLQESGKVRVTEAGWIDTFADRYVEDIHRRLAATAGPVRPRRSALENALAELAYLSLRDPQGADPRTVTHSLINPALGGEGTFLERAVQSGLLKRSGERVRFCHALFAEFFCARHLVSGTELTSKEIVAALAQLPGRRSLAHFVTQREPSLLLTLTQTHPELTPVFQVAALGDESKHILVERARELLASEYPSERRVALRILGELRTPAAIERAVEWFNGLDQKAKLGCLEEAADLFLHLRLPGAVQVIVRHPLLQTGGGGFPWYDPEFALRLEKLEPRFRQHLADQAIAALESGKSKKQLWPIPLLAYLRDPRLLLSLRQKALRRALKEDEHRALFHFNTDEAMDIFTTSREHAYAEIDAINADDDRHTARRASIWDSLIPHGADVLRFPHDALVRTAKRDLEADDPSRRYFGFRLANFLKAPEFIDSYAEYTAERWEAGFLVLQDRMIHKLVANIAPREVIALYRGAKSTFARQKILEAAGEVYSETVEDLLLEALDSESLFCAACIGLAQLRSQRAGPKLYAMLPSKAGSDRRFAIKALGRIQYSPALSDFLEALHADPADESLDELIVAIGLIGGAEAYGALAERYTTIPRVSILTVLLDASSLGAWRAVHNILDAFPETKYKLGQAFAHGEWLHDDRSFYRGIETASPEFHDNKILHALLESARMYLDTPPRDKDMTLMFDCMAIARFDAPEATQFFKELAERDAKSERKDVQARIGFARRLLAFRGDRRWAVHVINQQLDAINSWATDGDFDGLRAYPSDLVLKALAPRLREDPQKWLRGYALFCPRDDSLLLESLALVSRPLADAIQQRLPTLARGSY